MNEKNKTIKTQVWIEEIRFHLIASEARIQPIVTNYKEYLPDVCLWTKQGICYYAIPIR